MRVKDHKAKHRIGRYACTVLAVYVLDTVTLLLMTLASTESYGGIKGPVQDHHHLSLVPAFFCHPLLEQEGSARREDYVLTPSGLFS